MATKTGRRFALDPAVSGATAVDDHTLLSVPYRPQLTEAPWSASLPSAAVGDAEVKVIATEVSSRRTSKNP